MLGAQQIRVPKTVDDGKTTLRLRKAEHGSTNKKGIMIARSTTGDWNWEFLSSWNDDATCNFGEGRGSYKPISSRTNILAVPIRKIDARFQSGYCPCKNIEIEILNSFLSTSGGQKEQNETKLHSMHRTMYSSSSSNNGEQEDDCRSDGHKVCSPGPNLQSYSNHASVVQPFNPCLNARCSFGVEFSSSWKSHFCFSQLRWERGSTVGTDIFGFLVKMVAMNCGQEGWNREWIGSQYFFFFGISLGFGNRLFHRFKFYKWTQFLALKKDF